MNGTRSGYFEEMRRRAETMEAREWTDADGSPVVMVHGFVVSGEYFVPTVEVLAPRLPLLVPDLPGFGRSPGPSRPMTVPQLAASLTEWVELRLPQGGTLVANSFGCQIAADAAMRRPDLIERLVLISPAIDPGKRRLRMLLPALLAETSGQSLRLQWLVFRHYLRTSPRRVVATLRHALWDRIEDKLAHIPVPALVIWGTEDPLVSREWAETASRMLPQGRLRIIEGAPHAMNFETPELLAPALEEFLIPEKVGR